MGLLVMLCSRSDYVAHFDHEKDISCVMSEVQDLLSVENYKKYTGGSSAFCTGQSFTNLIYHLAVHLGVGLHLFFQPCIYLVSEWCRLRLQQGTIDEQVMPYLFPPSLTLLQLTHNRPSQYFQSGDKIFSMMTNTAIAHQNISADMHSTNTSPPICKL